MSANKIIYNLLSTNSDLLAVIPASRMFFGSIPQNASLPALTYSLISENEITSQAMTTIKLRSRVQITIATKDYKVTQEIRQLVKFACNHRQGVFNGIYTDSVIADGVGADFRDDELRVYYTTIDFRLVHNEAGVVETYYLLSGVDRLLAGTGDLLLVA